MKIGWTKNWRKKWDNAALKGRPNHLLVWDWILSFAEWREENERSSIRFDNKIIKLKLGQVTCGSHQIAEYTGCAPSTVRRVIKDLENEHLIEHRTDFQCSLITVKNWSIYQSNEQGSEQRVSSDRAASEQRVSTNKEVKNVNNVKTTVVFDKSLLRWLRQQGKRENYARWIADEIAPIEIIEKAWKKVLGGFEVHAPSDFVELCKSLSKK